MPKELSGIMLKTSISALLSCSTYLEMAFQKDMFLSSILRHYTVQFKCLLKACHMDFGYSNKELPRCMENLGHAHPFPTPKICMMVQKNHPI